MKGLMNMKNEYLAPDLELYMIHLKGDVLVNSDPDQGVTTGSGSGQDDPGVDPFGDPGLDP